MVLLPLQGAKFLAIWDRESSQHYYGKNSYLFLGGPKKAKNFIAKIINKTNLVLFASENSLDYLLLRLQQ